MADEVKTPSGLNAFGDPSKLNFFGASDQDQQEYQNALLQSLNALEERYSKPNYWKIAAAFAKPQLGGFMASLGSANEVMGENLEQQRASQLPIAQLRAQLAMSKIGMGQNKSVADQYKLWKDSGEKPEELMTLRDFALATAPNAPVTQAISKHYDSLNAERQLASSEQANAIGRIQTAYHFNEEPNPEDLAFVRSGSPTLKRSPVRPQGTVGGNADLSKANADMFGSVNFKENPELNLNPAAQANAENKPNITSLPIPNISSTAQNKPSAANPAPSPGAGFKVNIESMPDVTSLYNNPKIKNPKSEAIRAGTLSQEYAKAMQSYYDASQNKDEQAAQVAGANMAATARELQKMGLQPPVIGSPTGTQASKPVAAKPTSKSIFPDPIPVDTGKYPVLHPETPAADLAGMSTVRQNQVIENRKSQAVISEEAATPTINSLLPYTNDSITIPLYQSLKASKDNIDKYPQYARSFYDVLGQGGLDAQIGKAFQEGGGLSWNALVNGNASFNIPARAWKQAGLPEEIASFGNTQLTERARQIALEAQLNGTRIDKVPVAQFHTVSAANPSENMRWDAARHAINVDATDVYFKSQLARQYLHELQGHAYAPNEMAPKSAILKHSPNMKSLYSIWAEQKDRIQRERQKELEPKKP